MCSLVCSSDHIYKLLFSQGIDFTGADLSRLDLRYVNFKLSCLKGCNLSQANLYCCSLERADLSGAMLDVSGLQFPNIR